MRGYRPAEWEDDISEVQNANEAPLYKAAELRWSKPTIWRKTDLLPTFDTSEPFDYALIRNHGKSLRKDHIEYIGLTTAPKRRFGNHKTAKKIVSMRGEVRFTYAPISFIRGRNRLDRIKTALEEIEHVLIWTIYDGLRNERKQYTLPGMGKNGGNAWQIINTGYRFSGQMPREIVYPSLLVKPGRDRSRKRPPRSVLTSNKRRDATAAQPNGR